MIEKENSKWPGGQAVTSQGAVFHVSTTDFGFFFESLPPATYRTHSFRVQSDALGGGVALLP
jgi:hypothetical protein